MTKPLLTPAQKVEIYVRRMGGEMPSVLCKEYVCSERLVQRVISIISKKSKSEIQDLLEDAGLSHDYKPRLKVKAKSERISMERAFELWVYEPPVAEVPEVDKRSQFLGTLVTPHDRLMKPVGLALKRGRQSVTGDGAIIIHDADGKIVKVHACPVYNPKYGQRFATYQTVDVVEVNGEDVSGITTSWSGEKIPGKLYFYGLGNVVSFVRFIPEKMPKAYEKEEKEIREALN